MHLLDQNNMMQSFINKIIYKNQIEAKLVKIAIVHNLMFFFSNGLVLVGYLSWFVRTSPYDIAGPVQF